MKYLPACLLALLANTLSAQESFPYQWFHPAKQYLYVRADELLFDVTGSGASLVGMRLMEPAAGEDAYETYVGLLPSEEDAFCHEVVPSFAGRQVVQRPENTTLILHLEGTDSLVIRNTASPGATWPAGRGLLGRVDSVREESFLGTSDSVKYYRFVDGATGDPVGPSVRVSRSFGLLTGTFFWRLADGETLELYASEAVADLPPLPAYDNVFDVPPGTELFTSQRTVGWEQDLNNSVYRYQWERRVAREYIIDEENDARTLLLDVDRYRYARVGGPDADEIIDEVFTPALSVAYGIYSEDRWLDGQPGEYVDSLDGSPDYSAVVEARLFDCYGIGKRARLFTRTGNEDCLYDFAQTDLGPSGYYFAGLGGGYFVGGGGSWFNLDAVVAGADTLCGPVRPLADFFVTTRDFMPDERVRVYPNPSTGTFFLSVPPDLGPVSAEVYSAAGRLVTTLPPASGDRRIELTGLVPGIYTVLLAGREGSVARRRVVVR